MPLHPSAVLQTAPLAFPALQMAAARQLPLLLGPRAPLPLWVQWLQRQVSTCFASCRVGPLHAWGAVCMHAARSGPLGVVTRLGARARRGPVKGSVASRNVSTEELRLHFNAMQLPSAHPASCHRASHVEPACPSFTGVCCLAAGWVMSSQLLAELHGHAHKAFNV